MTQNTQILPKTNNNELTVQNTNQSNLGTSSLLEASPPVIGSSARADAAETVVDPSLPNGQVTYVRPGVPAEPDPINTLAKSIIQDPSIVTDNIPTSHIEQVEDLKLIEVDGISKPLPQNQQILQIEDYKRFLVYDLNGNFGDVNSVSVVSAIDVPSRQMATATLVTLSELHLENDIVGNSIVIGTNVQSTPISELYRIISTVTHTFKRSLVVPVLKAPNTVTTFHLNNLYQTHISSRIAEPEGGMNGIPYFGADAMSKDGSDKLIEDFQAALNENTQVYFGVNHTITSGGARNVLFKSCEVVKAHEAYRNGQAVDCFLNDTLPDLDNQILRSILPSNQVATINLPTEEDGPQLLYGPQVSVCGINNHNLLAAGSIEVRGQIASLINLMSPSAGVVISKELLEKFRTELRASGNFGAVLAQYIQQASEQTLAILAHACLAPTFYDIRMDELSHEAAVRPYSVIIVLDLLALAVVYPQIFHALEYVIIPFIMKALSEFDFMRPFMNNNHYSQVNVHPTPVSREDFYSEDHYPNILRNNIVAPGNAEVLVNLLNSVGDAVDVARDWDPIEKGFRAGTDYRLPNQGDNTELTRNINRYIELATLISRDQSISRMTRSDRVAVETAVGSIIRQVKTASRRIPIGLGLLLRKIGSSPAVNAPVLRFTSIHGHHVHAQRIMRDDVPTAGPRTILRIHQGTGLSSLTCLTSKFLDENMMLTSMPVMTVEQIKREREAFYAFWQQGEKSGLVAMASLMVSEVLAHSIESIAPLRENNTREFFTPHTQLFTEGGNGTFVALSVESNDAITNPTVLSQMSGTRPMPAAIASRVMQEVSAALGNSAWANFITQSDQTHTAAYLEREIRYDVMDGENNFTSGPIRLALLPYVQILASCVEQIMNLKSIDSPYVTGIVLARVRTTAAKKYGQHSEDHTDYFDWRTFLRDGSYTPRDSEVPIEYTKTFYVRTTRVDPALIPAECTHVARCADGDAVPQLHTSWNNRQKHQLYVTTRANYANNTGWTALNPIDTPTILIIPGMGSLSFTPTVDMQTIASYIENHGSSNFEPGYFVVYDKYTLFRIRASEASEGVTSDPPDLIMSILRGGDVQDSPRSRDDSYVLNDGLPLADYPTQVVRFPEGNGFEVKLLAIRPNAYNTVANGEEFRQTRNLVKSFNPAHWTVSLDDGAIVDSAVSSAEQFGTGQPKFLHNITLLSKDTLKPRMSGAIITHVETIPLH